MTDYFKYLHTTIFTGPMGFKKGACFRLDRKRIKQKF